MEDFKSLSYMLMTMYLFNPNWISNLEAILLDEFDMINEIPIHYCIRNQILHVG